MGRRPRSVPRPLAGRSARSQCVAAERGYTGTRLDNIAEAAGLEGFIAGLVKDENAADGDGPAVKMAFDRRLRDPREPAKSADGGGAEGEDEFDDD